MPKAPRPADVEAIYQQLKTNTQKIQALKDRRASYAKPNPGAGLQRLRDAHPDYQPASATRMADINAQAKAAGGVARPPRGAQPLKVVSERVHKSFLGPQMPT